MKDKIVSAFEVKTLRSCYTLLKHLFSNNVKIDEFFTYIEDLNAKEKAIILEDKKLSKVKSDIDHKKYEKLIKEGKIKKPKCNNCEEKRNIRSKTPYCFSCKIPMIKKDNLWVCPQCNFYGKIIKDKE